MAPVGDRHNLTGPSSPGKMWQHTLTNQRESILWLTKNQGENRRKRAEVGRKKAMKVKRPVAAGICFIPAGMMARAIMFTPIGAGSPAGGAARWTTCNSSWFVHGAQGFIPALLFFAIVFWRPKIGTLRPDAETKCPRPFLESCANVPYYQRVTIPR